MIVLIRQKYITGLFLIIAACLLGQFNCFGQEKDIPKELYTSAGIPDSLKEDAHSVVRYSMENIEVKGPGKLVSKVHYIVTILDEKGDDQAEISLPYNRKFETVSSFEMIIYDADGKQVKKYHKSDMYDLMTGQ
jgi:hypothetical protein